MKWNNPERWFLTRNIDFESQIKHILTTILKDMEESRTKKKNSRNDFEQKSTSLSSKIHHLGHATSARVDFFEISILRHDSFRVCP